MSAEKRPASDDPSGQLVVKRQNLGERALARANASGSSALVQSVRLQVHNLREAYYRKLTCEQTPRTSGLQAPVMELSGHSGEIFSAKFDPSGNLIASGGMDRSISEPTLPSLLLRQLLTATQCSGEPTATARTTAC